MERNHITRNGESGITILLVAMAMVGVLAMAALAVDIVALYFAKAEAQRAADATALAAAKMFVLSGYTSNSSAITQAQLCVNGGAGGAGAVNKAAESTLAQNLVTGQAATLTAIACDFTQAENPLVAVTIQQTGLPTLFARPAAEAAGRSWGAAAGSVSASAKAEAFNPAGGSTNIAVGSVKPWLIPNCSNSGCTGAGDPLYFDSSYNPVSTPTPIGTSTTFTRKPINTGAPTVSQYLALDPPQPNSCPSSGAIGCGQIGNGGPGGIYRDNIGCSNTAFQYSCGQHIGSGAVQFDTAPGGSLGPRTNEGVGCLIHASNSGPGNNGQDSIPSLSLPLSITGGTNNPNANLQGATNISRSDSVVTVPVYVGGDPCPGGSCSATVIGFLQLFIQYSNGSQISTVVMNAAGCNPGNTGTPVSGGFTAVSPIPVRLIHP